ncbi:MAG: class I tRNA ligase family protein [Actinomycetota bacterium]|nr:class I tRNA ligase family protein [Actinomycetota bacterium]
MPPIYITTPIYYVNDAPHVGTAYTTVNADAIARWHRLIGDDVMFLTGTDEHGAKIAEAAAAHAMSPQEWTDTTVQRFLACWKALDIGYDDFIRTTEPRHHAAVGRFLQEIYDRGYIELGTYSGLYCISCEDYYTEEQLDGGDCPVHHRPVVPMEEENYFFKLSEFEEPLLRWYAEHPGAVLPQAKRNEAVGFIRGGLRDISITRTSFRWGVPVPWDERHVFYVWYDALVNYLTAIGYGVDAAMFDRWWPVAHHLVGKDILKFHCVWWPAMCMAAGIDPAPQVFVHGFLLVGGERLSKTLVARNEGSPRATPVRLTEIAPESLVDDLGADAVRYHLLREVPLGSDGEFSYEGIVSRYNADLANNLGNLLSRVATVVGAKCGGIGPAPDPGSPLAASAASALEAASEGWDRWAPHEALEATWRLIGAANAHLEATEPWKLDPGPEVDAIMGAALEALRIVALLVSPAMPGTACEIWTRLGLDGEPSDLRLPEAGAWGGYPGGLAVEKGAPLFPRRRP